LLSTEVPASAEESAEEVKGVVVSARSAAPARLLMLFYALVPVLVVDAAGFGVREDLVGIGDFYEFLVRGFVAAVLEFLSLVESLTIRLCVVLVWKTNGFLSGWYFLLRLR